MAIKWCPNGAKRADNAGRYSTGGEAVYISLVDFPSGAPPSPCNELTSKQNSNRIVDFISIAWSSRLPQKKRETWGYVLCGISGPGTTYMRKTRRGRGL